MFTTFSGEKNCHVEIGPKMTVLGKNWGKNLRYWFVVCRILRQNRCARLGCSLSEEQKRAESLRAKVLEITHAQNQNP